MENKRNLLVTLSDRNYIQQVKQLFSSVYWNAGWEGDYMLLSHDIPENDLKWFRDKGILVRKCEPLFDTPYVNGNYPTVILDKLYLFTQEFRKWKNIVYLDSDIIVKASLNKLTRVKYFSAVKDIHFNKFRTQFNNTKEPFIINSKTYDLNVLSFNAGMYNFNTDMITPGLFNELTTLLKDNIAQYKYGEQGALNLYFYKKWTKLPPVFNNFINYYDHQLPKYYKSIILHFARRNDSTPLWSNENYFYQEWKANLEKAELIDLSKIQKVIKWNILSIKFYSALLNIRMTIDDLKNSLFRHKLESFFRYRLKHFLLYIIMTPDRFIGKIGAFIKEYFPGLYYKLKKLMKN